MRRPTRGKIFCEKSPPLNGADRFCSSCRSRPFNDPSRSTISNTQSPENCCLHLIPPYVYCISNEAYFSCRNIWEAFFFSIFFFLFWVWFLFFSLSLLWMYIQRRKERVELCSVTVRGGGGRLAEAQKSRRLSERPHDLPPLCAAARI